MQPFFSLAGLLGWLWEFGHPVFKCFLVLEFLTQAKEFDFMSDGENGAWAEMRRTGGLVQRQQYCRSCAEPLWWRGSWTRRRGVRFTCHELWGLTEGTRSWMQVAKQRLIRGVAGLIYKGFLGATLGQTAGGVIHLIWPGNGSCWLHSSTATIADEARPDVNGQGHFLKWYSCLPSSLSDTSSGDSLEVIRMGARSPSPHEHQLKRAGLLYRSFFIPQPLSSQPPAKPSPTWASVRASSYLH